jgi:hypothetical protein
MTPDSSSPSIKVDIQTRRADQPDSAYVTLTGAVDGWLSDDKVRLKVTATDAGDSPVSIGTATGYTCTLNDGRELKLDKLTDAVSISRDSPIPGTDGCPRVNPVSSFIFNNTTIINKIARPYNLKLGTNTLVLLTNCKQFDTVRMDFKDLNRSSWNFNNLSNKMGEGTPKNLYSLSRSIYCVKSTPTIRSFSGAGIKNFFYSTDNLTYTGISFSGTTLSGVTLYDSTIEFYFDLPTVAGKTMENVYTYYFKVEDAALVSADNNQSLLLSSGNTSPTAFVEVKVDRTPPVSIAPESSWRKSLSDFGTGTTQSGTLIVADIYRRDEIFGTVVSIIRVNPVTFSGRSYNIVQSEDLPPLDWDDQEELPQLVNRLYKCQGDFSS